MKKTLLTLSLIFIISLSFGQEKTFKSSSSSVKNTKYESNFTNRIITIGEKQIIIGNYLNGGQEDLVLDIERLEKKDYSYDGLSNWFYCKSTTKDFMTDDYTKFIVIIKDSSYPRKINVFQISDEVTIFHTSILLN